MTTLTEVKERPILFSTPMVKAILEGNKTVTRRIIKVQPDADSYFEMKLQDGVLEIDYNQGDKNPKIECPYGKPGDVLWVRETWAPFNGDCGIGCEYGCHCPTYIYKADYDDTEVIWKPSIHMPRAACRLRLEIVSITVERLQDITEEDAKKEGAPMYVPGHGIITQSDVNSDPGYMNFVNYRMGFEHLWRSINGPESWNVNPWVWRIEFKRIQ